MRIAIAWLIVVGACARNVRQDQATSTDGKIAGAKHLELEDGVATDTGIVTYPGGDRVDWKQIELPDKQHGALDIRLTWRTPRPGLQVAFDVFDRWNARVASSRKTTRRSRHLTIAKASGTYFIRVYAPRRGDAGQYRLGIEFDGREEPRKDPMSVEVDNPPKLADLPPINQTVACDVYKFDFENPDCHDKCPAVNPPASWPGCRNTCTATPPDPAIPACAKDMDCPPGGDIRVRTCRPADFRPCPDPKHPDPTNLNCLEFQYPPVVSRIGRKMVVGGEVEVLIMAGSAANIDTDWTGVVLQGDSDRPLPGGAIRLLRLDVNTVVGRVKLTAQQVEANRRVRLSPPSRKHD